MIKMKLEIIPTKGILYDKCENVEQLYDNYYYPLLVEFKELQKQNADLKEHYNNMFECHCNRVQVEQLQNNWNELKKWAEERIKNANKCLNDPNENWDEDANGYVLARKFQLEETLKKMQELEQGKDE